MRKNIPRVDHREYTPANEIGQRIWLCLGLYKAQSILEKYSKEGKKIYFFIWLQNYFIDNWTIETEM
jgi:hypothetical protein